MKKQHSPIVTGLMVILLVFGTVLPLTTARAATNHTEFTENLLWCYQSQTRVQASAEDAIELYAAMSSDDKKVAEMRDAISRLGLPSANIATVPREWYVRTIRAAAATRDAEVLKRIYAACQLHNDQAMEYLYGEDPINMVRAARYIVACKPTSAGGGDTPGFCSELLAADKKDCNEHGCGYDITWPFDLH